MLTDSPTIPILVTATDGSPDTRALKRGRQEGVCRRVRSLHSGGSSTTIVIGGVVPGNE